MMLSINSKEAAKSNIKVFMKSKLRNGRKWDEIKAEWQRIFNEETVKQIIMEL